MSDSEWNPRLGVKSTFPSLKETNWARLLLLYRVRNIRLALAAPQALIFVAVGDRKRSRRDLPLSIINCIPFNHLTLRFQ